MKGNSDSTAAPIYCYDGYHVWILGEGCCACGKKFWEGIFMDFQTKDSGQRQEFSTGMVRDIQKGKARFDLIDKGILWRWAELMGRGAEKYGERNWEKASTDIELARFMASAERHLQQLLRGDTDEDHAAAVLFNVAGIEYVREKLNLAAKNATEQGYPV